jgi:fungal type III polyketide synthase
LLAADLLATSMKKVLGINQYTGIDARSSIGTPDHPLVNQPNAPSIAEVHAMFMSHGVPLAVSAAQKAITESRIELSEITHMVSTTCTDSANPGYDHFVAKQLGITHQIEKVLLHGMGCSGGLAALRTAAHLALSHRMRRKPARILVVALEISTTLVRSELDSINADQECRIGVALFSDCAGALVLSNGIGESAEPIYDLLAWEHAIIPDTEEDLGFDIDPLGKCYFNWGSENLADIFSSRLEGCSITSSTESGARHPRAVLGRFASLMSASARIVPCCGRLRLGNASGRRDDTVRGRKSSEADP